MSAKTSISSTISTYFNHLSVFHRDHGSFSQHSGVIFPVHSLEDAHAMVELCLYPSRLRVAKIYGVVCVWVVLSCCFWSFILIYGLYTWDSWCWFRMFFPYLQYVNEDGDSYCFTWFDNALSDVHTQQLQTVQKCECIDLLYPYYHIGDIPDCVLVVHKCIFIFYPIILSRTGR